MPPKEPTNEAEAIELEWKRLQIEELREKIEARNLRKQQLLDNAKRQLADFNKAQELIAARQRICKHRKGGKDNRFANGNDNNYAVIKNTYPTGVIEIMCTRCFKTVRQPDPRERKSDPKGYAERLALWKEWDSYPTDNSPSGGKIFEIIPAVA